MDAAPMRVAVLVSGNGSNLQALLEAQAQGQLGLGRIVHVLSNRPNAYALQRAHSAGVPHACISLAHFKTAHMDPALARLAFERAVAAHLQAWQLDLVVLAGWLHIFSAEFLQAYTVPMINLHPALPGTFVGTHAIADAYAAFQAGQLGAAGCMVHRVIAAVDAGAVLDQEPVPITAHDSADDFQARMRAAEHRLLVRAVRDCCTANPARWASDAQHVPAHWGAAQLFALPPGHTVVTQQGAPLTLRTTHYVWAQVQSTPAAALRALTAASIADLARLLQADFVATLTPPNVATLIALGGPVVSPRLGTISPWGSKAADIAALCGLPGLRLERVTHFDLSSLDASAQAHARAALFDRMTQTCHAHVVDAAAVLQPQAPQQDAVIAFMQNGRAALTQANREHGLGLGEPELQHVTQHFEQEGRNPTLAELMMFAQANSEHCRHRIFHASYQVDGVAQSLSLFDYIGATHRHTPQNTVVAYRDNAAIVGTRSVARWQPNDLGEYTLVPSSQHGVLKAETHNHPTAISPFAGAATGAGGEIRDGGAAGRGAVPKAGMSAFATSLLTAQVPAHLASPCRIMIDGPLGAAAFNNEFGRAALGGFWRAFEQRCPDGRHYGYHKPIMLAAGWGSIRAEHAYKLPVRAGDLLVQIGGPGLRIGVGGGAASSMASGSNDAELDFASVQRDNPEMQRRAQMVINACVALGAANPIRAIHDVGAGGLSNALPELVAADGLGARIDMHAIPLGESGMSAAQLWCNESQERYVLALAPADRQRFAALCARERCPFAVLGVASATARFVVQAQGQAAIVDWAMSALLGGLPQLQRAVAAYQPVPPQTLDAPLHLDWTQAVQRVLAHPTVASKRFLLTIADRTVGGCTHRDPMVGPWQEPVADCAVTLLDYVSLQAEAVALGERMPIAVFDAAASVRMALAEALTNLAAAPVLGLEHVKLSCNWMAAAHVSAQDSALRAAVAAASAWCQALQLAIPVGKDSLSMQVRLPGQEPVTAPLSLVVTAWSLLADLDDTTTVYTPELQQRTEPSCIIYLKAHNALRLGASILQQVCHDSAVSQETAVPDTSASNMRAWWAAWQALRASAQVLAYHDVSDGGVLAALCEMAFAARTGLHVDVSAAAHMLHCHDAQRILFQEETAALLQVPTAQAAALCALATQHGALACVIAQPQTAAAHAPPGITVVMHGATLYQQGLAQLHQVWERLSGQFAQQRDHAEVVQTEAARLQHERYTRPGLQCHVSAPARALLSALATPAPQGPARRPRVAILREQGVNSMQEMAYAWHVAGWQAVDVTMTDLIAGRHRLQDFQALAACGGFSFGDVLGAGSGWARSILCCDPLQEQFRAFFARPDTLALGVCNGCQMLSQLDSLMPCGTVFPRFGHNASGRYEARFSQVEVLPSPSIFLADLIGSRLPIPVAHGEGRVTSMPSGPSGPAPVAMRFIDELGAPAQDYPANPNGSLDGITGVCSLDGRITLIMPHPERICRMAQWSWRPAHSSIAAASPWQVMFVSARRWIN